MAREKNTSFAGVPVHYTQRGEQSLRLGIQEVAGDMALLYDKLTGSNAESAVIDHRGTAGRGCPLGVPLVNQYVGRSLSILNSSGTKDGGEGETNFLAVPIFIPQGNLTGIVVELFLSLATNNIDGLNLRAILTSTTLTEVDNQAMTFGEFALGMTRASCTIDATSAGLHLLFIRGTTVPEPPPASGGTYDIPIGTLHSWCVRYDDPVSTLTAPPQLSTSPYSVWTPAATEGLGHRNFDGLMFANNAAYHAWLTCGLDRNINSIIEYTTGWPAGGNASYTHIDHDGAGVADPDDPARSRFHAGTRSLYSAEPEFDFPLFCEALGAFKTDGGLVVDAANPPTRGMLDWFAPWPTATARQTIRYLDVIMPDFQTASSRLKIAVLLGSDAAADVTDWTISVNNGAARTTLGAPTACSAANIYWLAQASAASFSPDVQDTLELEVQKTTGAIEGIDQMLPLGWCMYFEPP